MIAIYKRELSSYFRGFIGYVITVPLLLMAGIYSFVYNFLQAYPQFEYVLSSLEIMLLFVVPVLTMRVLSEEKNQRTDQLLYSLPTTMTRVVLGKYLAMVTVLALPMAVIGLYPLLMSRFGTVPFAMAYGNLFAFFLLGCALIAMGQFISSAAGNQTISLVLCLLVMLVNYFLTGISSLVSDSAGASMTALVLAALVLGGVMWLLTKNLFASAMTVAVLVIVIAGGYLIDASLYEGLFSRLMEALSLFARQNNFRYGLFDVTAIVYYLAVIGVFLFLSVQSMEKRRWNG